MSNTDVSIINFLVDTFGGQVNFRKMQKAEYLQAFVWQIRDAKAIELLKEVLPYLKHEVKLDRARLIVDEYYAVTPRNGKYTEDMRKRKADFE